LRSLHILIVCATLGFSLQSCTPMGDEPGGTDQAVAKPETATDPAQPGNLVRIHHQKRQIEGWTVYVDESFLEGEHKEAGNQVLSILAQRLHQISLRLPPEPVARMKEVPIYLDRAHPLGGAHYHPEADWLIERGYDPSLAQAVHLTRAEGLIREAKRPFSTSVILHELAHAYHDLVLGFDHPDILESYRQFCDSRQFDEVDLLSGRRKPHYGLTDHKEYFAEMTETFFVGNSHYPFNHLQLYREHPESYELMTRIWGSDMRPPVSPDPDQPRSILDLRILANLKSQRGDLKGALELLDEAEKRSSDSEGRLKELRKRILSDHGEL
jgi:hypothetical protein